LERNVLFARILLIILCATLTGACFYQLNQSYDPLARYPYATEKNRATILKYMDSHDIDYIISQQIRPSVFMDFIKIPGFNIRLANEYHLAKQTQEESNAYIVNFVNKYSTYFTSNELEDLLTYYTYADLTTFYENDATTTKKLTLQSDPTNMYLVLNTKTSVYRYQPANLVQVDSIQIQSNVVDDWNEMKEAYSRMWNGETLSAVSGYQSYDTVNESYMTLENQYGETVLDRFQLPAGQNETQLGYTIQLINPQDWIDACQKNQNEDGTYNYENAIKSLSQSQQNQIVWLEENAYHYGFVIRYPEDKADKTKMAYQPFVLRYVGRKAANKMWKDHLSMEEMDFEEYQE